VIAVTTSVAPSIRNMEKQLRQQEQHLTRVMVQAVEQGREVNADETNDVADQAVLSYQKEMLFTQGTEGRNQLHLVRNALARISEGTFGECVSCHETIGAKRMEAVPWTPYCIACQEKAEAGELHDAAGHGEHALAGG
jgi:DnaK suppressor protein